MKRALKDWLAEDIGNGDFTSQAVVDNLPCKAVVTGGPGIISGVQLGEELLKLVNVNYDTSLKDGDHIETASIIFNLEGLAHDILRGERVLLNIL